jgi:nucleotide-binding universal stress UspA family protein
MYVNAILKKDEKAAKENISKIIEPVKAKTGIPITFNIIPVISASDAIAPFAKSHKIDLVVMGSHGRTGFSKVLLGSVSQGVQ